MSSPRSSLLHFFLPFLVALASSAMMAQANFVYTTLDEPSGFNTEARGINASGEIAGFYQTDTTCVEGPVDIRYLPSCHKHGFTYANGTYTTVDVPGAVSTVVNGLNDLGDLVGDYTNPDGSIHGFLWLHTGTITNLDNARAAVTIPMGVNKSMNVVGQADGYSFRYSNQKFYLVTVHSGPGCANCNGLSGIANSGLMVGFAFKNDFWVGFLKAGSDFDFFPHFNDGDSFTDAVNSKGDIVGYGRGSGYYALAVEKGEGTGMETEKAPVYVNFNDPDGYSTYPFGVNDNRTIVGAFEDASGIHGFEAVPQM